MGNVSKQTRTNRTITIDFQHEATYVQLLGDGQACLECVLAFILSIGFQLTHKATSYGQKIETFRFTGRCMLIIAPSLACPAARSMCTLTRLPVAKAGKAGIGARF
jgi:hypothetical protein